MKIYLVTSTEYDDYDIRGAFSTEEKAHEALKLYCACCVTEHEIDPPLPDHPPGLYAYSVSMEMESGGGVAEQWDAAQFQEVTFGQSVHNYDRRVINHRCWARDEGHAIHLTDCKRLQLIKDGNWKVGRL